MNPNGRRTSQALGMMDQKMDSHAVSAGGMIPMEGIEGPADSFLGGRLPLGMGLTTDSFVGLNGNGGRDGEGV
jgi:hypothetical protein